MKKLGIISLVLISMMLGSLITYLTVTDVFHKYYSVMVMQRKDTEYFLLEDRKKYYDQMDKKIQSTKGE